MTLKYNNKLYSDDGSEDPNTSNNVLEIRNGKFIRGQIEKSVMMSATIYENTHTHIGKHMKNI